ncbi:MAG: TolC family protein, partial [Planctomycetota bacterium]
MDRQLKPRPVRLRRRRRLAMALALMTGMTAGMSTMGCRLAQVIPDSPHDTKTSYHDHSAMQIEYPDVARCVTPSSSAAQLAQSPHALTDPAKLPAIEMTLPEAVQRALQFSPVIRNLGGTVVSSPQLTETVFGPALAHANPQSGVEAALAAFDAQYTQSLSWDTVDQPQNVEQGGLGAAFNPRVVQGTTGTFANALSKRTATGTEYTLRNNVVYDNNNRPFREFT